MASTKITSTDITDMKNAVSNVTIAAGSVDNAEYPEWGNPKWPIWLGYYQMVPELRAVIDAKATWSVGKGYQADAETKAILNKIKGMGKDTFNNILHNAVKTYTVGGDFFAENIRHDTKGTLLNLKPLTPSTINILSNRRGIIKRYVQRTAEGDIKNKFNPEEMFHLPWNRIGESIHGQSTVEAIESTILSFNEAYADMKTIFHRYVKPLIISVVDTDDTAEISAYKNKLDKAVENGENMVVPKGTLDKMERMSIPQYSTLDPLPWIQQLQRRFVIAEGVPEVILGHGQSTTEATSKILYLAFQQTIEYNQNFIQEQIDSQLDLKINLEFPASLEPAMQTDVAKERNPNNFQMKHDAKK